MLLHIFCILLQPLLENTKDKLSQFCHVPVSCSRNFLFDLCFIDWPSYVSFYGFSQVANILNIHDVPNIWHVPLLLRVGSLTVL